MAMLLIFGVMSLRLFDWTSNHPRHTVLLIRSIQCSDKYGELIKGNAIKKYGNKVRESS
jgi:hypothetical protein